MDCCLIWIALAVGPAQNPATPPAKAAPPPASNADKAKPNAPKPAPADPKAKPGAAKPASDAANWPHEEKADPFNDAKPLDAAGKNRLEALKRFTLGAAAAAREQHSKALVEYRAALALDPNLLSALQQAAPIAAQLDRSAEALDFCKRALKIDPNDAETIFLAGLLHNDAGDTDEALRLLEQVSKLPWVAEDKPIIYVQSRVELERLYERRKDYAKLAGVLVDLIAVAENPERLSIESQFAARVVQRRGGLYQKMAAAYRGARQYDKAIAGLKKVIDREGKANNPLYVELAQTQLESGDGAAALATLEGYLKAGEPRTKAPYELLVRAYSSLKRDGEILARLEKLHAEHPGNDNIARLVGARLVEVGRYADAERILRNLAADRESIPLLLRTYRGLKQPKKLLDTLANYLQTARADDDENKLLAEIAKDKELVPLLAEEAAKLPNDAGLASFHIVANVCRAAGEHGRAADFFARCVKITPAQRFYWIHWIRELTSADRHKEAVAAADTAPAALKDDVQLAYYRAAALVKLQRVDEAVKSLEALRERGGGEERTTEISLSIAEIHTLAKRWEAARSILVKVLADHPDGPDSYGVRYFLANVHSQLGKHKDAEAELLKIIEASPAPRAELVAGANNDLGYMWADEGRNLDRAEQMIRSALKSNPDNAAYLDSMGWVLFKRGRYAEAKEHLEKAANAEQADDPVLWDHFGDCLLQLGDRKGAMDAFDKAIRHFARGTKTNAPEKAEGVKKKLAALRGDDPAASGQQPKREP